MTTTLWCLVAAMVLPYVWAGVASYYRKTQLGTLDNKHPREQATHLTGAGARAYAAQLNAWEALGTFGPAAVLAHVGNPTSGTATILAIVFVACRVGHGAAYIANVDKLRSTLFAVGYGCALGLVLVGAKLLG